MKLNSILFKFYVDLICYINVCPVIETLPSALRLPLALEAQQEMIKKWRAGETQPQIKYEFWT